MPSFAYRALLPDGATEAGVVNAPSKQEAARRLAQQGRRSFYLAQDNGTTTRFRWPAGDFGLTKRIDLGQLFAELSVLLNAGFTIDRALGAVISGEGHAARRKQIQAVLDVTTSGRSIAEAFLTLPGISADVAALLASGERSGKMAYICQRLAENFEARAKRRTAIIEALTYPAFLLVVMFGALIILATVLVPALEPIFEGSSAPRPLTMRMLSALGTVFTEYPFIFPLVALAGLLAYLLVSKSSAARNAFSRWSLKIPLFGPLITNAVLARYLDTLSLLLGNGVTMSEALRLAAGISQYASLKTSFSAIEEEVANGVRLHPAAAKAGIFDNPTLSLISLGDDANALPVVLDRAGRMLQAALTRRIDMLLKLLTPALTISLGLLVGSLVVSVMTTILSINDLALQ
ncbi:type II secretion system F family protein [Bradyrhizobium sp. Arg314]